MRRTDRAKRLQTPGGGESMTVQADAEALDVNVILGRYIRTGDISAFNQRPGRFGDFSNVEDYHACLNKVNAANEAFQSLPAKIRDHFKNDPAELLTAAFDPARESEFRSLGLIPPDEGGTESKTAAAEDPTKRTPTS